MASAEYTTPSQGGTKQLGSISWFTLGLAFWLVLDGLGSGVSIPNAVSILCATTLLGSVTMLPGGLVATEGSMLLLLQRVGMGSSLASAAILVIRICTLWFAVLLGLVALFLLQRYQRPHARVPESGLARSTGATLLESEMVGGPGN